MSLSCSSYVIQPSAMVAVPNRLKWRIPARGVASQPQRPVPVRQSSAPAAGSDFVRGAGPRVSWNLGPQDNLRKAVTTQEGIKVQVERVRSKSESHATATATATMDEGVEEEDE